MQRFQDILYEWRNIIKPERSWSFHVQENPIGINIDCTEEEEEILCWTLQLKFVSIFI
jgi:hypothetical protein